MVYDSCVPAHGDLLIAEPCNALAYVLNVFARYSHNDIVRLRFLRFIKNLLTYESQRFGRRDTV